MEEFFWTMFGIVFIIVSLLGLISIVWFIIDKIRKNTKKKKEHMQDKDK